MENRRLNVLYNQQFTAVGSSIEPTGSRPSSWPTSYLIFCRRNRAMMTASFPSSSFFVTGGTLSPSATSYVVRQADTDLYENLLTGEFCYVLNSRQMGKFSLMVRTAQRLKQEGRAVAVLDLQAIGQNLSPEQWYEGLLLNLGKQVRLEDELEEF